jgi:hypothetical protein
MVSLMQNGPVKNLIVNLQVSNVTNVYSTHCFHILCNCTPVPEIRVREFKVITTKLQFCKSEQIEAPLPVFYVQSHIFFLVNIKTRRNNYFSLLLTRQPEN